MRVLLDVDSDDVKSFDNLFKIITDTVLGDSVLFMKYIDETNDGQFYNNSHTVNEAFVDCHKKIVATHVEADGCMYIPKEDQMLNDNYYHVTCVGMVTTQLPKSNDYYSDFEKFVKEQIVVVCGQHTTIMSTLEPFTFITTGLHKNINPYDSSLRMIHEKMVNAGLTFTPNDDYNEAVDIG